MKGSSLSIAVCLLAPLSLLRADWPAGSFSIVHDPTGTWIARLHRKAVGDSAHRIVLYKLDQDKEAFSLQRSITHVGPHAPNHALITNDGEYLVTFDSSFSIGTGKHVVVVYGKSGRSLKTWSLEEILTPQDLNLVVRSVSNRRWRQTVRLDFSEPHRVIVSGPKVMISRVEAATYTYTLNLDELSWTKVR
jgi:hypothetical protein